MNAGVRRSLCAGAAAAVLLLSAWSYVPNLQMSAPVAKRPFPWLANAETEREDARVLCTLRLCGATAPLLQRALKAQPLDQAALGLLVQAWAASGRTAQAATATSTLARLGWRDTPSQRMMAEAALRRSPPDYDEAARRFDAVMRRDRTATDLYRRMLEMEQHPSGRRALRVRLGAQPHWRLQYLAAPLPAGASLSARADLVAAMIASGDRPNRAELHFLLDGLMQGNRPAEAHALWQRALGRTAEPGKLYDPNFAHAAAAARLPSWQSLPFEWAILRGPTFNVGFADAADAASAPVTFRWNGRGSPLFARQTLYLPAGSYVATASGTIDGLSLRLVCQSATPSSIDIVWKGSTGSSLPFSTAALRCAYPDLQLRGREADDVRPSDVALHSLDLAKVS